MLHGPGQFQLVPDLEEEPYLAKEETRSRVDSNEDENAAEESVLSGVGVQKLIDEQCRVMPELRRVDEEVGVLENGINVQKNLSGNVVIVGAGITGLVAAMLLEDKGVNVVILEVRSNK